MSRPVNFTDGLPLNCPTGHAWGMVGKFEDEPGPGALPDPDKVQIPGDASDLDADLFTWRAEQTHSRHPIAWIPPTASAPWHKVSRSVPVLIGALLMVAFLVSLVAPIRPATVQPSLAVPGNSTSIPDGQIGGLLPRGIIDVNGATHSARNIGPAALVLLPSDGADPALLDALYLQSTSHDVPLALVGPPEREQVLASTAAETGGGRVRVVIDRTSAIAESIDLPLRHDPTVVVVGANGQIHAVIPNPGHSIRLGSVLARAAAGADPGDH